VQAVTGVGTATPLLRLEPTDDVLATIRLGADTNADLDYLAKYSVSLKNAGIDQIGAADGVGGFSISVSQLSSLMNAGTSGLVILDSDTVTLNVTNADDLTYVTSNAANIANFHIDAVSLAASVQNLSLTQASSLANAKLLGPSNAVVSIAASDIDNLINQIDVVAKDGFKTFSLNGATISVAQASALATVLNNDGAKVMVWWLLRKPLAQVGMRLALPRKQRYTTLL
jgi:hypothetical protein